MKITTLADKTATSKAIEIMFPSEVRLYNDPYVVNFISPINRLYINILKSDQMLRWMIKFIQKKAPGVYGAHICRTRYMDDIVKEAIDEGFKTVVNLGGGYDTRCLRIEKMSDVLYYHIDQPEVINRFKNKMAELPTGIPSGVRFVPIDFNKQSLEDELARAGYDKSNKTLFLWEGVTQYITEEAMIGTLDYIASTTKGSQVVFTYVLKALLENPNSFQKYKGVVKRVKKTGFEWITGIEPNDISNILMEHGLNLIEDVGAEEYKVRYFEPINRDMEIIPIERIAWAEVMD